MLLEVSLKNACTRFLVIVMSLWPCIGVADDRIEKIACLAYWQLRSVGLEREYGIESAKKSNQYQQNYKSGLHNLKQKVDPGNAAKQVFASMKTLLEDIDYNYDRTGELDAKYAAPCLRREP
ncbi:MAG: hypothetical protein ACJA09_002722 [Alcanivorax sp.]|jgi:hypothetical protein